MERMTMSSTGNWWTDGPRPEVPLPSLSEGAVEPSRPPADLSVTVEPREAKDVYAWPSTAAESLRRALAGGVVPDEPLPSAEALAALHLAMTDAADRAAARMEDLSSRFRLGPITVSSEVSDNLVTLTAKAVLDIALSHDEHHPPALWADESGGCGYPGCTLPGGPSWVTEVVEDSGASIVSLRGAVVRCIEPESHVVFHRPECSSLRDAVDDGKRLRAYLPSTVTAAREYLALTRGGARPEVCDDCGDELAAMLRVLQ